MADEDHDDDEQAPPRRRLVNPPEGWPVLLARPIPPQAKENTMSSYDALIQTARDVIADSKASAADLAYAQQVLARHDRRVAQRSKMGLDASAHSSPFRREGSTLVCDLLKKGGLS